MYFGAGAEAVVEDDGSRAGGIRQEKRVSPETRSKMLKVIRVLGLENSKNIEKITKRW